MDEMNDYIANSSEQQEHQTPMHMYPIKYNEAKSKSVISNYNLNHLIILNKP